MCLRTTVMDVLDNDKGVRQIIAGHLDVEKRQIGRYQ